VIVMHRASDRGFWFSWHDLAPEDCDAHLAWLHGTYIPKVLKMPGVLWAAHFRAVMTAPGSHMIRTKDPAVPDGSDHIVMFGGESTAVFTRGADAFRKDGASRLDRDLSDDDMAMLAMRKGERQCVLAEEMRVHGPERGPAGETMQPGPYIQLGSFNCPRESEEQLLAWYADFRLPAVQSVREFIGARKLLATSGWVKHVIMYEFLSRGSRERVQSEVERRHPDGIAWTQAFIPALTHAPRSPVLAERVWPPVGT
jgi:hypothetical protein